MYTESTARKTNDCPLITDIVKDVQALVDEKVGARILGLTNPRTLAVWRCTGAHPELPFRKVGGRCVRYLVADLLAFRDAQRHGPEPP